MPSAHDSGAGRMADGTQGITYKPNNTTEPRITTRDARIVAYDETGLARIILGIVPEFGNEPVFAVSKEGYDVLDALGIN